VQCYLSPQSERIRHMQSAGHEGNLSLAKISPYTFLCPCEQKLETPLHRSPFHGQHACATLLVRNGADRKAQSKQGKTPLDMAIQRQHPALEKYLKKGGKAESDAASAKKKGRTGKGKVSKRKRSKSKHRSSSSALPFFVPPLALLLFLIIVVNLFS